MTNRFSWYHIVIGISMVAFLIALNVAPSKNPTLVPQKDLSHVKVASLYERVTDGKIFGRSIRDVAGILKETSTDFVFRGFWIWGPIAENCSELPTDILEEYNKKGFNCEKEGYSYSQLKHTISIIKKEIPDIIFNGAIPAQRINFIELDPITNIIYRGDEVDNMALDPAKWGITSISKEDLQKQIQSTIIGLGGYFPDITDSLFKEIMLNRVKKLIDCGADAIWIDGLFGQARLFERLTHDSKHPAVRESFVAASTIVDRIHEFGRSKGKYIYVGTWYSFLELPYSAPNVDFITVAPSYDEIVNGSLNEAKWDEIVSKARTELGSLPIFAFIDWGTDQSPMVAFSQNLTADEQKEFLRDADDFFAKKGIVFVYPVHGGFMGGDATRRAFGKYKKYDALAPEFDTYETIKKLALEKVVTSFEDEKDNSIPQKFKLLQNYPNPFNLQTTIRYELPVRAKITLIIYDVLGRKIRTLVKENQSAGNHAMIWDGKNDLGNQVSTGIYFYQLQMNTNFFINNKFLFIKSLKE